MDPTGALIGGWMLILRLLAFRRAPRVWRYSDVEWSGVAGWEFGRTEIPILIFAFMPFTDQIAQYNRRHKHDCSYPA